jgi:LacI family transcriptional regulator
LPDRVTIADVARLAGVSTMTVSRVINAKGDVRASTRARVERAIAQLEYRPSQAARTLTTRRSRTLGLLVPDITNPFFPEIVRGAEDVAWEEGYMVSLANTVEDAARERAALEHFEDHRVDGLLICSARLPESTLEILLRRHQAVVLLNRRIADERVASLEVDDAHGARLAVAHLVASGRRTIALLAGPLRSSSSVKRRAGYGEALEAAGLSASATLVQEGEPSESGGESAVHALLERRSDVDAIVCYNDVVAIGALAALHALGRAVPADVSVVGCDDVRLASLVTPALTTLRIDTYALGRQAAQLLFERLRGEPPRHVTVQPHLVIRASAP